MEVCQSAPDVVGLAEGAVPLPNTIPLTKEVGVLVLASRKLLTVKRAISALFVAMPKTAEAGQKIPAFCEVKSEKQVAAEPPTVFNLVAVSAKA